MTPAALRAEPPFDEQEPQGPASTERAPVDEARLRRMLDEYFDFVWRSLRRFGLSDDRAEDAAQQVFMIASRKLDVIQPESERSFLFGTAMRVASDVRRSAANRREVAHADAGLDLADANLPDELLDQRRARAMLDRILDAMELELRTVFVLFEIEEMSTAEIAALVGIPHGTVASRLRRAREDFESRIARLQRAPRGGGA
jgi:RNA polymerase sigma-70 factor (ECF subfamily)